MKTFLRLLFVLVIAQFLTAMTSYTQHLRPLPKSANVKEEGINLSASRATKTVERTVSSVAATINVPGDQPSIQAAVTAAANGDVINVGAGTWVENVVVNKSVTISGAGAGSTIVVPSFTGANVPGGSLAPGHSTVFLIRADNVNIQNLTVDGDNPALTSGIVVGGADIDARNGIMTDFNTGTFNGLNVYHVTIQNIYLRGVQNTDGTGFNIHHNTVQNVQASGSSIAMFNSGGGGIFANNSVSDAGDGISANHSRGTQFLNNTITTSASGIHTDNAGDGGGSADLIDGNTVTNSQLYGYGIWVFVPYIAPTVQNNTVSNVDVGMGSFAGAPTTVTPLFMNNTIDGMAKANSAGFYTTNTSFYWGSMNVATLFKNNIVKNNTDGFYIESDAGYTLTLNATYNLITGNTNGVTQTFVPPVPPYLGSGSVGTVAGTMSCNWWGDVSGPTIGSNPGGLGQSHGGTLGYTPWLIYGTDANLGLAGFQLPVTVPVAAGGDVSLADNDYRRLANAFGCAVDGQTLDLSGTFNWSLANSGTVYQASSALSSSSDLRGAYVRDGVSNLTITSSALNAHIIGRGDFNSDAVFDAFLAAYDGPGVAGLTNLIVEKLNIDTFEGAVMLGWNATGQFNGTKIRNNTITIGGDNSNDLGDAQNIAIYFWNGTGQQITNNIINFKANGTRSVGTGARSFGFQNGTTGGAAYNGLLIDHNTFQLLPGATTETIIGLWENGHNDDNSANISITNNTFLGLLARPFDRAMYLTSQTTGLLVDGNTFTDVDNVLFSRNAGGGVEVGDRFTFSNNVLTRVGGADGVFLSNVTTDPTPTHVKVYWNINNTVDGETGIRGLNELSTQATHTSRPSGGALDLDFVVAVGPRNTTAVKASWGSPGRFTDPDGIGTGAGPVAYGFNTYSTIKMGIDSVTHSTVYVLPGTYNEQLVVSSSLTLQGVGTPKPIIDFTGTPTGKPTLIDISADKVTIDGIHFNVDLSKFKSAIIASDASIDTIVVTNNVIDAYGAPMPGNYGDRNAVGINYGGPTNYRVATGGVNSITFSGNTVNGTLPTSFFRAGLAADVAGGTFSGNTLQTINHDILVRFGSNGNLTATGNFFNGGGLEFDDIETGAGTITISNNVFDGTAANPVSAAMLRLQDNFIAKPTIVSGNTFVNHLWAVNLSNYNAVTLDNNTFTPLAASTTYHHVTVNTKVISTSSSTALHVTIGATLTNNTFNGSGTLGGTALSFLNHDIAAASFGTFTLGTPGNENKFNAGIANDILLDGQSGTSSGATFPNYNLLIGAGAGSLTTMAPWAVDLSAKYNKFDVGSGLKLPLMMTLAERATLETLLMHKPDNAALGLITYVAGGGIWVGGHVNPVANDIFAGIDAAALDGVDALDYVAPPPPAGDYLYLYFRTAPGAPLENYSVDIKKDEASLATTAKAWDLKAITDHTSSAVTLTFPDAGLPSGFKATLYELSNGKYQNLRANSTYLYTSPATVVLSSFKLLIGDSTKPAVAVTAPNGGEFLIVGTPTSITWTSSDASGVLRHYVYYSLTGGAPYTLIDSTNGNVHTLAWTPMSPSLTASVKVVARDSVMNEQVDVSDHTFTILASNSISFNAIAGWNLVSPPMLQGVMSPSGIFGDDYGVTPYYTFQYSPVGGYSVPTTLNMGQGYWLGSNSAQVVDAVGTPQTAVTRPLAFGFNIIGNPFPDTLYKADLLFTDGATDKNMAAAASAGWISNVLYGYSGTGYYFETWGMGVWKGYWVPVTQTGISAKYLPSVVVPTPKVLREEFLATNWHLEIGAALNANGALATDDVASFGVRTDATAGYDKLYDAPRPPRSPAAEYVEISFGSNDGQLIAQDFRGKENGGWEFTVMTSREGSVTLHWDLARTKQFPAEVKLLLRDEVSHMITDMRQVGSYTYEQQGVSRRFTINSQSGRPSVPVAFALAQNYPNPFNPTTKIAFDLPVNAEVHMAVYDLLGKQLAELVNGEMTAGYHDVTFDASALAGGVYVCRMDATGADGQHYSGMQKMLLVK